MAIGVHQQAKRDTNSIYLQSFLGMWGVFRPFRGTEARRGLPQLRLGGAFALAVALRGRGSTLTNVRAPACGPSRRASS